jgi:hypothetical protein
VCNKQAQEKLQIPCDLGSPNEIFSKMRATLLRRDTGDRHEYERSQQGPSNRLSSLYHTNICKFHANPRSSTSFLTEFHRHFARSGFLQAKQ